MGRRSMEYEERLEKRGGGKWARKCWVAIKKKGERRGSRWEEQTKEFYRQRGISVE